jgi:hypothetical protein
MGYNHAGAIGKRRRCTAQGSKVGMTVVYMGQRGHLLPILLRPASLIRLTRFSRCAVRAPPRRLTWCKRGRYRFLVTCTGWRTHAGFAMAKSSPPSPLAPLGWHGRRIRLITIQASPNGPRQILLCCAVTCQASVVAPTQAIGLDDAPRHHQFLL